MIELIILTTLIKVEYFIFKSNLRVVSILKHFNFGSYDGCLKILILTINTKQNNINNLTDETNQLSKSFEQTSIEEPTLV